MSWDAIGAIGELLGALAVIATLAYLAKQIRQNTDAVLVQTYSALSGRVSASNAGPQTEYLGGILERGRQSYRNLAPAEQLSFGYWMLERVMMYEAVVDSPEATNTSVIESSNRNLRHLFSAPGVREWWQSDDREDISGRMRDYVNDLIESP